MDTALIVGAALLGLAGTPHCAAMCGAPCAAVCGTGRPARALAFHLARVAAYATAGAVAAASVGLLSSLAQLSPALRPLWALLHALLLSLGLWLLWQGRQPAWMGRMGRIGRIGQVPALAAAEAGNGWAVMRGPAQAAAAGGLWVAWPCGLLQSALLLASLTGGAAAGASAMAAFAGVSSGGLLLAPWVWHWLSRSGCGPGFERALVRGAGGLLVLGSSFALGAGVWHRVAAFCGLV